MDIKDFNRVSKALSDRNRVRMLIEAAKQEWIEYSDLLLTFNLSQPTISHHIKILRDAGLLVIKKDGTRIRCSLGYQVIDELNYYLQELVNQRRSRS